MFHLRDELANQPFGSRVKDVFANLGTGLVQHNDQAEDVKNRDKSELKNIKNQDKPEHNSMKSEEKSEFRNKRVKYSKDRSTANVCSNSKESDQDSGRSVEKDPEYEPFKRPNNWKKPAHAQIKRRGKPVADHRINPDKWTKYSLADVSPDQMSDRSNTKAALQFLHQLKEKKAGEKEEPADLNKRVVFKKRGKNEAEEEGSSADIHTAEDNRFSGNVRVMPQYEIGTKVTKKKKTKKIREKNVSNSASLKLSHLDEDEDEDEDGCD